MQLFDRGGEAVLHYEYRMPFAEWFHRYPAGEEISGPGSGLFRPGPIPLDGMPTDERASASGRESPDRGR